MTENTKKPENKTNYIWCDDWEAMIFVGYCMQRCQTKCREYRRVVGSKGDWK